jgi:hypothetical protein
MVFERRDDAFIMLIEAINLSRRERASVFNIYSSGYSYHMPTTPPSNYILRQIKSYYNMNRLSEIILLS